MPSAAGEPLAQVPRILTIARRLVGSGPGRVRAQLPFTAPAVAPKGALPVESHENAYTVALKSPPIRLERRVSTFA